MKDLLKDFSIEVHETVFFAAAKLIINRLAAGDQTTASIIDVTL